MPSDTTVVLPLLGAESAVSAFGLNQPTIFRIRGEILASLTDADISTAGDSAILAIGIAVIDDEDALAGGNPDDPFSESWKNIWMFHRYVYLWNTTGTNDQRSATTACVRMELDVKSRRIIRTGETLVAVVAHPPGAAPGGTAGCSIMGRMLLREGGR